MSNAVNGTLSRGGCRLERQVIPDRVALLALSSRLRLP
jgi:hypothetical protein